MVTPALTILLSSFLLFLVQPILAKQILPWFGGSAGVWTICLAFFQLALLLGYTYAHWLTRRPVGARRLVLHILLLLISCLALPIIPGSFWKPGHDSLPALRILGLLIATVGLPYVLLASTGPLLQHWLSRPANGPSQDRSVYRLFALSNMGSIVGLLAYPFVIEPFAPLHVQAWVWSCAYVLLVACLISYAWKRRRMPDVQDTRATTGAGHGCPPSPRLYAYWIGCATLGSALLLAVTNQITQNVASIPFLWIAPLTIYLVSFVICFDGGWYERRFWLIPAMLATGGMAWALFADQANLSIYWALPIDIVGLLFGCIVCHGELARSKPNPQYLTQFYLSLAAGGALGGALVGVVAPIVFSNYWEMPLGVTALAGLGVYICAKETPGRPRTSWAADILVALVATSLVLLLLGALPSALNPFTLEWAKIVKGDARWGCAALLVTSALVLQKYHMTRAIALAALLCTLTFEWGYYRSLSTGVELVVRNFYGTLRVIDSPYGTTRMRRLKHGVILHGSQVMEPPQRELPTTYYGETSGIGRTILSQEAVGPLRIGSIGLGAGTLAVYARPGDVFRAYELNPAVLKIAENQFTYISESRARVEPVLGDGRLSLEDEIADGEFDKLEQRFDILSLDAFSGDGIPIHLLTREAFATYTRVIKPDGVIAFHLSNSYLDLPPVVEQVARDAGFQTVLVADRPSRFEIIAPSDWVLVTRSTAFIQRQEIAQYSHPIARRRGLPIWTDQFSNLFQILK